MASLSESKKLPILCLNTIFLILLSFYLKTHQSSPTSYILEHSTNIIDGCTSIKDQSDYQSKCSYIQSQIGCKPKGYINYLHIFYCIIGQYPVLGYLILLLWLVMLFYLLGDTAANYFCSSLERLSSVLNLSPTIAGVTLLSLGNGAADVFASIVSFTRSKDGDVGLNIILGGAFFVSSVVVGIISVIPISPSHRQITIDRISFVRDVGFFISALSVLLLIIFIGRVNLWGALSFVGIYVIYVCAVCASQYFFSPKNEEDEVTASIFFNGEMGVPLLIYIDDEKANLVEKRGVEEDDKKKSLKLYNLDSSTFQFLAKCLYVLELPLYLPRRLTIPVVSQEKWSKPYAVISVTLAPILLVAICESQSGSTNFGSKLTIVAYISAGFVGLGMGSLAFVATKRSSPPKKWLLPWLGGGFLMSVTWTYILAEELVSLLVSLGYILGLSPSILGLTVLAWGNSIADLITNVTMAKDGGPEGAQIAISGCYAGPMFNTLVGLGLSLVLSAWSEYPSSYVIPIDNSLYETIGFLIGSLLWALVMLPKNHMRLDRLLGIGLLAIYLCFLFLSLARALGFLNFYS